MKVAAMATDDAPKKPFNYDRTGKKRQARLRRRGIQARAALAAIEDAQSLEQAKEIARAGLRDPDIQK